VNEETATVTFVWEDYKKAKPKVYLNGKEIEPYLVHVDATHGRLTVGWDPRDAEENTEEAR